MVVLVVVLIGSFLSPVPWAHAEVDAGVVADDLAVKERHGETLETSLAFTRMDGTRVTLGDLAGSGVPIIFTPVYFNCPRLCGLLLDGVISFVKASKLTLGEDYRIVSVSFDPTDTPERAVTRFAEVTKKLAPLTFTERDWEFLVADSETIRRFMTGIGFGYRPDGVDFSHSAILVVVTTSLQISQYFHGIQFREWDVRLALVEAGLGAIGGALEHIALFCFRFDQSKGRYTWAAFNVMRVGATTGCLMLVGFLVYWWRRERQASASRAKGQGEV